LQPGEIAVNRGLAAADHTTLADDRAVTVDKGESRHDLPLGRRASGKRQQTEDEGCQQCVSHLMTSSA
jgi:hypothetical protein